MRISAKLHHDFRSALHLICSPRDNKFDRRNNFIGWQAQALLLELQAALMTKPGLRDVQRAKMLDALSVADKSLVDGADEFLQLLSVSSQLQQALAV